MDLSKLNHVELPLPNGGLVFVIDTGALIDAESLAMLQALHSRSIDGIKAHLKVLSEKGAGKFIDRFYVGYGHASIGDCGFTTIFIEGVSMLVAKAVQDSQLYNGQEASTRYIPFDKQLFIDPDGYGEVLEGWREMYTRHLPFVQAHVQEQNPFQEGYDEKDYERAVSARAFDIMRGFLPAGASTNLAWTVNLRQAHDRIDLLRHHPLSEVRTMAETMLLALQKAHPNSFGHKRYPEKEAYNANWMKTKYYFDPLSCDRKVRDRFDYEQLEGWREELSTRPAKCELPKQIAECGELQFEFLQDFGSFRDIQRQRSVAQRMPRLTPRHGFHPWYLDSLPQSIRGDIKERCHELIDKVEHAEISPDTAQYYYPMGLLVACRITGDLPAHTYIVELRAQSTVHPTLHETALWMAGELDIRFRDFGLKLYVDKEVGRFNVKRGKQIIELKS